LVRRVRLGRKARRVRTVPRELTVRPELTVLLARLRCLLMQVTRASWALMV
jgi:hypothetical protein